MKLYTSNYARSAQDPKAVGISAHPPWWYRGRTYDLLAPTWDLVTRSKNGVITTKQYVVEYLRLLRLRSLDPRQVADELGDGAIMLCYESPNKFCHRHVVAVWMGRAGIEVEEKLPEKDEAKRFQVEDLLEF